MCISICMPVYRYAAQYRGQDGPDQHPEAGAREAGVSRWTLAGMTYGSCIVYVCLC